MRPLFLAFRQPPSDCVPYVLSSLSLEKGSSFGISSSSYEKPVLLNERSTLLTSFNLHAKSPQSCPTLCNPIDGSPPDSPVPGILQAGTLDWVAISLSNAGKWKVKVKSLNCCNPMDCSPPGSSVHGILQARVLEWGATASYSLKALYPNIVILGIRASTYKIWGATIQFKMYTLSKNTINMWRNESETGNSKQKLWCIVLSYQFPSEHSKVSL